MTEPRLPVIQEGVEFEITDPSFEGFLSAYTPNRRQLAAIDIAHYATNQVIAPPTDQVGRSMLLSLPNVDTEDLRPIYQQYKKLHKLLTAGFRSTTAGPVTEVPVAISIESMPSLVSTPHDLLDRPIQFGRLLSPELRFGWRRTLTKTGCRVLGILTASMFVESIIDRNGNVKPVEKKKRGVLAITEFSLGHRDKNIPYTAEPTNSRIATRAIVTEGKALGLIYAKEEKKLEREARERRAAMKVEVTLSQIDAMLAEVTP